MKKNPCYKCPKRKPGCHPSCKDYLDWKAELDVVRERVKQKRELDRQLTGMDIRRETKQKKGEWRRT